MKAPRRTRIELDAVARGDVAVRICRVRFVAVKTDFVTNTHPLNLRNSKL